MQHNNNSKVMIISTQTPTGPITEQQVAAGRTGQMIQSVTGGGMVHMHRDKSLHGNEKDIFQQNLKSNGWLVITGHGGDEIRGEYTPVDRLESKTDISCSASEYVNLMLSSNALKAGDHINVLLYVCCGASDLEGKGSFAQQLAAELSSQGLSSTIVASCDLVNRIGKFEKCEGDVPGKALCFRAKAEDIRIFNTPAGVPNKPAETVISKSRDQVFMTADHISMPRRQKELRKPMTDEGFIQAMASLPFKISKFQLERNKNLTREQAEAKINANQAEVIFRKSSNGRGIAVSYYSPDDGAIKHNLLTCHVDRNNQWRVKSKYLKIEVLQEIEAKLDKKSLRLSLGGSAGIWQEQPKLKEPDANLSKDPSPRSPK